MRVLVRSTVRPAIDAAAVSRAAAHVMRREGCRPGTELGVLIAGERAMRALNLRYRGVDRGTDVLAFPMADRGAGGRARLLGDVAVSAARARARARAMGVAAGAELLLYLVHGILHLCGHDDGSPGDRARMERRQRLLVGEIVRKGLWNVTV